MGDQRVKRFVNAGVIFLHSLRFLLHLSLKLEQCSMCLKTHVGNGVFFFCEEGVVESTTKPEADGMTESTSKRVPKK